MSIKDSELRRIRHSEIPKLLEKQLKNGLIQKKILNIFNEMKEAREELSYLSSPSSLGKFEIISKKLKYYIVKTDENYRIKKKVNLTSFEYCFLYQHLVKFAIVEFILLYKNYEKILNSNKEVYSFKCFSIITKPNIFLKNFYINSKEVKRIKNERKQIKMLSDQLTLSIGFILEKIKNRRKT